VARTRRRVVDLPAGPGDHRPACPLRRGVRQPRPSPRRRPHARLHRTCPSARREQLQPVPLPSRAGERRVLGRVHRGPARAVRARAGWDLRRTRTAAPGHVRAG